MSQLTKPGPAHPGMRGRSALLLLVLLSAVSATPLGHSGHDETTAAPVQPVAPGYGDPGFAAPEPGSYELPSLGPAGDGTVLDAAGTTQRLHELLGDRLVVLSFIYSSCSDVNGCPLATFVLSRVQAEVLRDERLRDRVRLLSLSFDPEHDTPQVMRAYGRPYASPGMDWRFLTTSGRTDLAHILDGYDQWIARDTDGDGVPAGTISHVLRVFLIDKQRRIRNIYSTSFLHAEMLLSDLRTLARE